MIITTVGIIGIVSSHAVIGVLGWLLNTQISNARSSKSIAKIAKAQAELARLRSPENSLVSGELITETIPEVVMSTEEHFAYLKKTYPEAAGEYQEKHSRRKILERADRYIMRLILAYNEGNITAKVSAGGHTLDFSNGDKLWIANKYYGYGRLYSSEHNPHVCYDNDHHTISLYTFLSVVDLEERISEPVLHLTPLRIQ